MEKKEWSIMVYMAGDNNLAVDMSYALEQIKQVAGDDAESPNLFVYYDGNSPSIPTIYCDFSDPDNPIYQPSYQITNKLYPTTELRRNEDAADFYSIINFVDWCVNTVEVKNGEEISYGRRANRYALIISGHSAGFLDKSLFKDESAEKSMSMSYLYELLCRLTNDNETLIVNAEQTNREFEKNGDPAIDADEYRQETTVLLGQRLSILGFDSCAMGMLEVAFQFSPFTETLIASEGILPEAGWKYSRILGCLAKNTALETKKIAERFVVEYIESQDAYKVGGVSVDMSAWDFTPEKDKDGNIWYPAIDNLIEAVGYFSASLIECFKEKDIIYRQMKRILLQVHWSCQSYMLDQNIDLGDFCELLIKECKSLVEDCGAVLSDENSEFLQVLIKDCENVLENLKKFVIISGFSGGKYQYSNGVSLFFPWSYETFNTVRTNYESLYFYRAFLPEYQKTSWTAFLELYLGEVARRGSDDLRKPNHIKNWAAFENKKLIECEIFAVTADLEDQLGTGQGKLCTRQRR